MLFTFVINILFVYSQEDPLASALAISSSGLTTNETLGVSSDSSDGSDHPATFKECPRQDLSILTQESLAEGHNVAVWAEPTRESVRCHPFVKFRPHPKISSIRYRVPKPFSRTLPQHPLPESSQPQRQLFLEHSEIKAEEVILDSD